MGDKWGITRLLKVFYNHWKSCLLEPWIPSTQPVPSPAELWAAVEMTIMEEKGKMKKFKRGAEEGMGEGTPYISSDVPATLELSQRFLIQIQFSSCSHPHTPLPLFYLTPHFSAILLPSLLYLSTLLPSLALSSSLPSVHPWLPPPAPHISPPPSHPLSLGGNMKGYLCADSRGGGGRKLINSLSGTDC